MDKSKGCCSRHVRDRQTPTSLYMKVLLTFACPSGRAPRRLVYRVTWRRAILVRAPIRCSLKSVFHPLSPELTREDIDAIDAATAIGEEGTTNAKKKATLRKLAIGGMVGAVVYAICIFFNLNTNGLLAYVRHGTEYIYYVDVGSW